MTIIGITGGSGSGKTTALRHLAERGALVIDCDALYHELLRTDEDLLRELEAAFPGIVTDGVLDRKTLGAIVFSDPEKLNKLNAVTHRHIMEAVRERLRDFALGGGELAALDAIELVSSGLAERCAITVGVDAPRETRIRRIMARDGISREDAARRIDAQHDRAYFDAHCTAVLLNDGSETAFLEIFDRLMEEKHLWKT